MGFFAGLGFWLAWLCAMLAFLIISSGIIGGCFNAATRNVPRQQSPFGL